MAEFISQCPYCNSSLVLQDDWIGQEVQCPQCNNNFLVPKRITTQQKITSGMAEIPNKEEEKDSFNFVCPFCKTTAKLPMSLRGQNYECRACCEKSIAEPTTERLCPLCQGMIKFDATVCKHCKQTIPLGTQKGQIKKSSDANNINTPNSQNYYSQNAPETNHGTNVTIIQQTAPMPQNNAYHNCPASYDSNSPKNRTTYILLGLFLGVFGVHDFYAGYTVKGIIKILLSTVLIPPTFCVSLLACTIWVIIDVICVKEDVNGVPFVS